MGQEVGVHQMQLTKNECCSAMRTFPTLVFGYVADAAFVRKCSGVFFAVQWGSPEQPFKSAFKQQTQTVSRCEEIRFV